MSFAVLLTHSNELCHGESTINIVLNIIIVIIIITKRTAKIYINKTFPLCESH